MGGGPGSGSTTGSVDRDVVVVGARCAGAPLAMLLARRGHDVLLLDRVHFPKDTISTLFIHRPGVVLLREWGVLDRLIATGCPAITRGYWQLDGVELAGDAPDFGGGSATFAPRRTVLDSLLVEAAAEVGAEVAEGVGVTDLLWDDGRVVGVRARRKGAVHEVRSRLVVGADGMHSTVAQTLAAPIEREEPQRTVSYYAIYDMPGPRDRVDVYAGDGVGGGRIPTHDGHTLVGVIWPTGKADEVRADLQTRFRRAIDGLPGLAELVSAGDQVEPILGMRTLPNVIRRSHGPGWALAGDAGYTKDPITAQGITDAFKDAQRLADAIDGGLRGSGDLGETLAEAQQRRDTAARPFFEWTMNVAELEPLQPQTQQLFQAVAADDEATTEFFGINAGLTDPGRFFARDNIDRILRTAS